MPARPSDDRPSILSSKTPPDHIIAGNIQRLRELFPDVVSENRIDFAALRQLLGGAKHETLEHYSLTWRGKSEATKEAECPATTTMQSCRSESVHWDTTQNTFIEGDNLEVLKILQSCYQSKIKMIYIDPPYNTGKKFVYSDSFQESRRGSPKKASKEEEGHQEISGRYHSSWLTMMYPRLVLAHKLLEDSGVLFVSIDDHEVHNLRLILDEIFGPHHFVTHIIWQHSVQPKGYSGTYSVHHNHILCYRKSDKHTICSLPRTERDNKAYTNPDNDPKGLWRPGDVRNSLIRPNLTYTIQTPSGGTIAPPQNGWRWSRETLAQKISTGEIIFSPDETRIIRKIYLSSLKGRTPETIWFGNDAGVTRDGSKELKQLFDGLVPFDTVKPMALIERMLRVAGVSESDIVLDFFAGSCSTAHAVMRSGLGRFIVVQAPHEVNASVPHGKTAISLGLTTIAAIGKARLHHASKSLPHATDSGFRVFKLK